MAISLKHPYTASGTDADNAEVGKIEWNAEHTFTAAANKVLGAVTAGAVAEIDCTAAGRNLIDDADAAAQRVTLGVEIGVNVQAYDADLTTWGAKTAPSGTVVGTTDTQTLSGKTITNLLLEGAIDEEEFTITDAAAFVIDPENGSLQKITLGASRTPAAAPAGWTAGKGVLLKIADGTAYTITWSTLSVTWVGGSAPTLATTGWTVVVLWKDADAIYGQYIGAVA